MSAIRWCIDNCKGTVYYEEALAELEVIHTSKEIISDLHKQLRAACFIKAKDANDFDWQVLETIENQKDTIIKLREELEQADSELSYENKQNANLREVLKDLSGINAIANAEGYGAWSIGSEMEERIAKALREGK
jgi:small-conductance mechanosensitive channel